MDFESGVKERLGTLKRYADVKAEPIIKSVDQFFGYHLFDQVMVVGNRHLFAVCVFETSLGKLQHLRSLILPPSLLLNFFSYSLLHITTF